MKTSISTKDIVVVGMMSALLITLQVALSSLPNIELVSILIILSTIIFGWKTLYIIYIFALVQGFIYGFTTWWICYLYVWTILMLITMVFKHKQSPLFWAILTGSFGLAFGSLCSIPFLFIDGPIATLASIVSGIPFDVAHCIGNYFIALVLFKPLYQLFNWIDKSILKET